MFPKNLNNQNTVNVTTGIMVNPRILLSLKQTINTAIANTIDSIAPNVGIHVRNSFVNSLLVCCTISLNVFWSINKKPGHLLEAGLKYLKLKDNLARAHTLCITFGGRYWICCGAKFLFHNSILTWLSSFFLIPLIYEPLLVLRKLVFLNDA